MVDLDRVAEFGEYVRACEKCASEAATPWKIATCFLTATLAVVLLAGSARGMQ